MFARKCLDDQGGFFPFGRVLNRDGRQELQHADPGQGEHPNPADVQSLLVGLNRARALRGEIRATAVCIDAYWKYPDGRRSDAIVVELEHRDSEPFRVIVPYSKSSSGQWVYEPKLRTKGVRRVFGDSVEGDGRQGS